MAKTPSQMGLQKASQQFGPGDPHLGNFGDYTVPQFEDYIRQHPGAAPGGTGETGLASDDLQGYTDLKNADTRYAELKSGQPMNIRFGGEIPTGEPAFGGLSDTLSPTYNAQFDPRSPSYLGAVAAAQTMAKGKK